MAAKRPHVTRESTENMYDPKDVEERWQAFWKQNRTNEPSLSQAADPFFNLMMFPYPSAEGLHVGNLYAFTGADVYGRFQRLRGHDVFQPVGFDAFGIHSENFALKVGIHPMDLIPANIMNFTRQLKRSGIMYDWTHTVDTTDPEYYRWTQWIFLQLYKAGLAEKKEAAVNWCPSCKTVLANEQVISGRCERCHSAVGQKTLSQWFFKITQYSQRLLDNLEWIDWSETTRMAQRNWIGRSEGATLRFQVAEGSEEAVSVFTTRPDTVYGATFLVLAPEHPLVYRFVPESHRATVDEYLAATAELDLVERKKTDKEKSGVFTGGSAVNPATGESVPVWIADYVLMEYGTGAIMAVPAHDQRDFEFARAYDLPIRPVVAPAGSVDQGSDSADLSVPAIDAAFVEHSADEVLINSGPFSGRAATEAGEAIVESLAERDLGEPSVNYRLHDWCISRQRYWGSPIPVVYCDECGIVPVPESDLPVVLPRLEQFKPSDDGIAPLAKSAEFYRVECPECGVEARRETDVSDTFLDSAWYFLRYPSTDVSDRAMDADRTRRWLPVDMYIGGEEHAVLHLLYSRFITMALSDLGHVDFEEPYKKFRKHGLLIRDGSKMSKSRGNVVIPDQYIGSHGADTFRAYLMFLGPYTVGGDFRDQGISGPHRFLHKVWDAVHSCVEAAAGAGDGGGRELDEDIERKLHQTIKQITEDFAELSFNTGVAALMEYLNAIRAQGRTPLRPEVEPLVIMLAPVAPHLCEQLWEVLGGQPSLFDEAVWPEYDASKLVADSVRIPVQVNGKLRGTVQVSRGASADTVRDAAMAEEGVRRHLEGVEVRKTIHVQDRLLNLVVG